jgi:hypothetical protein
MIHVLHSIVTGLRGSSLVPVALTATVSVKNGAPSWRFAVSVHSITGLEPSTITQWRNQSRYRSLGRTSIP